MVGFTNSVAGITYNVLLDRHGYVLVATALILANNINAMVVRIFV